VYRITLGAVAVSLFVLAACGNGDEATPTPPASATSHNEAPTVAVTPSARPETVPDTARPIRQTAALGRIVRHADEPAQAIAVRRLVDATCEDDVLVIETSQENIYAPLPCGRFWDPDSAAAFLDEPVAIGLKVTETRFLIFIETVPGAQAEFTVTGLWVD
jgi:hypothetical protein